MSTVITPRITGAVAVRVLAQLRGDRRTLALLLVMPCVILALLRWMFDATPVMFDRLDVQLTRGAQPSRRLFELPFTGS